MTSGKFINLVRPTNAFPILPRDNRTTMGRMGLNVLGSIVSIRIYNYICTTYIERGTSY